MRNGKKREKHDLPLAVFPFFCLLRLAFSLYTAQALFPKFMARIALVHKQKTKKEEYLRALRNGKKPKFATRIYNRCELCGRPRGYMGFFGICRICFRELATNGEVPGVKKASW